MIKNKLDIIVIGAGSGGLNIASFMNQSGFNVLLVDKSADNIGGDCLNFGCVPSKALIHIARIAKSSKNAEEFGITNTGSVDIEKVIKYIKDKQSIFREYESAEYFRNQGIQVELGTAKFVSRNSIEVNNIKYSAKKIILATGARPRQLNIPGIEKAKIYTNETIFDIDFLPKKFVVIGGGPIGIEIGHAFSLLGSEVTIISNGDKILTREDRNIVDILENRLTADGVKICFDCNTNEIIDGNILKIKKKNGDIKKIEFDAILVSIGRILNTENLDLEKAGIEQEDTKKIKVNDYMETTNKNVLLCGDIAGGAQFTHMAEMHVGIILRNFFIPFRFLKKKLNTDALSWVTYTHPEIATFGLSEYELKKRGIKYRVLAEEFNEDDRAIIDGYRDGLVKIFINKKGKIIGGTMVAPNAGELIQELVLAQSAGLGVDAIFKKIYPYPVATRINKRAASAVFRDKLTNFNKKLLKLFY